jgi:hypothetical protein
LWYMRETRETVMISRASKGMTRKRRTGRWWSGERIVVGPDISSEEGSLLRWYGGER